MDGCLQKLVHTHTNIFTYKLCVIFMRVYASMPPETLYVFQHA